MPKTVTFGIKVDKQFVNLLHAQVMLSGMKEKDELTPGDQLALIAYMEMRGALEEEIHAVTLHTWRNNITIVPELRKVEEDGAI